MRLDRYMDQQYEQAATDVQAAMTHAANMQTLLEELAQIIATARAQGGNPPSNARFLMFGLAGMEQRLAALVEQTAGDLGLSAV